MLLFVQLSWHKSELDPVEQGAARINMLHGPVSSALLDPSRIARFRCLLTFGTWEAYKNLLFSFGRMLCGGGAFEPIRNSRNQVAAEHCKFPILKCSDFCRSTHLSDNAN
mmetsp:Transcript_41885/g.112177  ORF Transcript_41885/g.112177 Transcript_41885/m.112177 type:complete len:110 (-) Transcript_41885:643-972(-)